MRSCTRNIRRRFKTANARSQRSSAPSDIEPEVAANHYRLAEGLVICGGSLARAKAHAESSLALRPDHRNALALRDEINALLAQNREV